MIFSKKRFSSSFVSSAFERICNKKEIIYANRKLPFGGSYVTNSVCGKGHLMVYGCDGCGKILTDMITRSNHTKICLETLRNPCLLASWITMYKINKRGMLVTCFASWITMYKISESYYSWVVCKTRYLSCT